MSHAIYRCAALGIVALAMLYLSWHAVDRRLDQRELSDSRNPVKAHHARTNDVLVAALSGINEWPLHDRAVLPLRAADEHFLLQMRQEMTESVSATYDNLLSEINLPPENLYQFKNLLIDIELVQYEVSLIARLSSPPLPRTRLVRLIEGQRFVIERQIEEVIGTDNYNKYQRYKDSLPERSVINEISAYCAFLSEDITTNQISKMADILTKARSALHIPRNCKGRALAHAYASKEADLLELLAPEMSAGQLVGLSEYLQDVRDGI